MERLLRWAITFHIVYLIALPFLGAFGALVMNDFPLALRLGGWIPLVVYALLLQKTYRLPLTAKGAAAVLLVPAELVVHIAVMKKTIWYFFLEAGFIQIASPILALFFVMGRYRPSGWYGAAVGLGMGALVVFGWGLPLFRFVIKADHPFLEGVILAVILATGLWSSSQYLVAEAKAAVGLAPNHPAQPSRTRMLGSPIRSEFALIIIPTALWIVLFVLSPLGEFLAKWFR